MVVLTTAQVDEIFVHAKELPKEEVCGVLGGRENRVETLYRTQNAAPVETRRTRFEMDPRDMLKAVRAIDDADLDLIGFYHSHTGWLFERDETNKQRFTPDLLADRDIMRVNDSFIALSAATLLVPAVLGGLLTWSWWGALTAFFWAGLVRVGVLQHVTWSVNSICHMIGTRPWTVRDRSTNFWPLAIATMGESWHNLHHADPTCARHGVLRGQLDTSARVIWFLEKCGWVYDVRWPVRERVQSKLIVNQSAKQVA